MTTNESRSDEKYPAPPNREPGTREHPNASRPRRDLEDRAAVEAQEGEGREHLYGFHTLDGQPSQPNYFGNRPPGRQARHLDAPEQVEVDDPSTESEPTSEETDGPA